MPIQSSSLKRRAELLKTVGVAVLVLGLIASSILSWGGGAENSATNSREQELSELGGSWKDGTLSPEDTKGSSRTIEMNYGKIAVLVAGWLHRLEALKPHQWLAIVIGTMATLIAIGCFAGGPTLARRTNLIHPNL
jgi:pyruvate/2-oxoglutarate dehydrogenase complex dihydrolipoamide acyltransferase (E2) component